MWQYAVKASLFQFVLHLVQISDFAIGKSPQPITEPPLCFTVGVIQEGEALSPTFHSYLTQRF